MDVGDNEGPVTYTLLRDAQDLKDNRLLPAGADKANLPADMAVYGAARDDPTSAGGGDLVTCEVDVVGATVPFSFSVELLYEPLWCRLAGQQGAITGSRRAGSGRWLRRG